MKTPKEIKKAFEQCMQLNGCNCCPYSGMRCTVELSRDALAYIKQLEERLEWIGVKERKTAMPLPEPLKEV